jgi:hypothetical protein
LNASPTRDEILARLDVPAFYAARIHGFRTNGSANNVSCRCPFHEDRDPSLSVNVETGLFKCHGCGASGSPVDFLMRMEQITVGDALRKLSEITGTAVSRPKAVKQERRRYTEIPATRDGKTKTAVYAYSLDGGTGAALKVRYEGADGKKTFRWYERDGDMLLDRLGGRSADLYQLDLVRAGIERGAIVILNEGEKASDRLALHDGDDSMDFVTTCGPNGYGSFHREAGTRLAEQLAGAGDVLVVVDRDEKGERWAEEARRHLESRVRSLRFRRSRVTTDKADLFDHLEAGHSLADLLPMAPEATETAWTPCTLEGVTDPTVGRVDYLVDRFIPKGEVVGIAATFKSGKTLMSYSLTLSAVRGAPVFGALQVRRPLRVVVFQEEMPSREDNRRLRRLAIGMGLDPAEVPGFVASGQLVFYNRVGLDLSSAEGVARFHDSVRRADAELVLIDSLIAAAGAVDLGENGPVRRMFTAAFLPLTTEGRSVVFLHHKRKGLQGAKGRDADRDSFLGAQAIAAASGRMYSLERLDDPQEAASDPTRFRCVLTLFGSWTPEEAVATVLETRDEGEGTTVTALDETAQVRTGGVDGKQRAALALAKLVGIRRCIRRKAALAEVAEDLSVSPRTAADGLKYAREREWIETEPVEGSTTGEQNLVPGPKLDGAL